MRVRPGFDSLTAYVSVAAQMDSAAAFKSGPPSGPAGARPPGRGDLAASAVTGPGVDEAGSSAPGPGRYQSQVRRRGAVREQAGARAEYYREHQQTVLIDEAGSHQ